MLLLSAAVICRLTLSTTRKRLMRLRKIAPGSFTKFLHRHKGGMMAIPQGRCHKLEYGGTMRLRHSCEEAGTRREGRKGDYKRRKRTHGRSAENHISVSASPHDFYLRSPVTHPLVLSWLVPVPFVSIHLPMVRDVTIISVHPPLISTHGS